jgi:cell shape-determining protein MreC
MAKTKIIIHLQTIQEKIYDVRGQKIMFDFDLAELYEVETRALNQAVKRNLRRFPQDFMFRLTLKEWKNMSSQIVMTSPQKRPKTAIPYAFTEHGVTMLASVLKSDKAIKMNLSIVRAFIALKQFAMSYKELAEQIQELKQTTGNHSKQLNKIYQAIENLLSEKEGQKTWENRERIGFKP